MDLLLGIGRIMDNESFTHVMAVGTGASASGEIGKGLNIPKKESLVTLRETTVLYY